MQNLWVSLLSSFAPMVVVAITALVVLVSLALKRSHFWSATLSVVGLNVALVVLALQAFGLWSIPAVSNDLFVMDGFAIFNMAVVLVSALACFTLSYGYFGTLKDNKDELYVLMLIATLGAMLMTCASHLASFFVSLELLSVPMYGMLAYTFLRAGSLESGLKYVILSAAASATLLAGMAFIYAGVGSMNFAQLSQVLFEGKVSALIIAGAVMMLSAIAFKLSIAPFHGWAGDVYEGSPAPVTAFLASVSKVAMMALAIRFLTQTALPISSAVQTALFALIALSIIFGNLLALSQNNLKRLFAFSSVAHMGYALIALLSVGQSGGGVVSLYMAVYALTSVGAFGVIAIVSSPYHEKGEADELRFYQGLFWRRPVLTAVLTIMLLSMAGIPLTAGFISKFMVVLSAVQGAQFWLAGLLIAGSGIGLYYYLKVITSLYQKPKTYLEFDAHHEWGIQAGGVMVLLVTVLIVLFGVLPDGLMNIANLVMVS